MTVVYLHLLCGAHFQHALATPASHLYCVVDVCSFRPDDAKKSRTSLQMGPFPVMSYYYKYVID
jgi:hypothetical protein